MTYATVSSWSCSCSLYRASPSLAAKNIINLISVLTIWWCPCVESSLMIGRGCLLWPVRSLGKTLLPFALLHFVFQGQICRLLQVSLDFLLFHSSSVQFSRSVNTKIRLIIFFAAKDGEALYSQQKQDQELTVAQIMNSLLPNSDLNWRKEGKPLDHSGMT